MVIFWLEYSLFKFRVFSYTGCYTKAKELSLPNYLLIGDGAGREQMDSCLSQDP